MEYLKTHLFTGWWTGTITRKPFVICLIAISLAVGAFFMVFVMGMVGAEYATAKSFGMSVTQAQDALREALSLPAYAVVFIVQITVLLALSALCAKRLRDIGLPGWPIVVVVTIVDAAISGSTLLMTVFLFALALAPSGQAKGFTFGQRS